MRALVFGPGGPSGNLILKELPAPRLTRPDQVRVRLHAAGINPIDGKMRRAPDKFGTTADTIPGCDGAGIVEETGAAVTRFTPGDAVYFCAPPLAGQQGTWADEAVVPEALVALKPRTLDFAHAAALPLVAITAWESLFDRAAVKKGDTVLIQAGAGGVGHVAVQLAHAIGARTAATVSSPEKAAFVRALGCERPIDYRREDVAAAITEFTHGSGVDMAFDTVGDAVFAQCFPLVRVYGDLVTLLEPPADTRWSVARQRNLRIALEVMLTPIWLGLAGAMAHQGMILERCAAHADDGRLKAHVAGRFPLEHAAEALRVLEGGGMAGKLVLSLD